MYCAAHSFLSCLTFAASQLWWRSHAASTVFLLCLFAMAIWNGSTFYFEVFGGDFAFQKYTEKLALKAKKAREVTLTVTLTQEEAKMAAAAAKAELDGSAVAGGEQRIKDT